MFKGKVVAIALMLLFATSVYAGDVDPCTSDAGVSCSGMKITVCPAGDFEWFRNGCGGALDYVWITAKDDLGNPIFGIPFTDYWCNACDATKQLWLCAGALGADSVTGAGGRTTFSNSRIVAGGCTWHLTTPQGIWWAIQGRTIKAKPECTANLCLDLMIKSPDIRGAGGPDGIINLSDLSPFGSAYNKPPGNIAYNGCCDYNDDTLVNLSDFAFFGQHYQHRC